MSQKKYNFVLLNKSDSVAVSLDSIPIGAIIPVISADGTSEIEIKDEIEFGHKFAVRDMEKSEKIYKYGETIGTAVTDIKAGQHVHIHNLEGVRGRGDKLAKQE